MVVPPAPHPYQERDGSTWLTDKDWESVGEVGGGGIRRLSPTFDIQRQILLVNPSVSRANLYRECGALSTWEGAIEQMCSLLIKNNPAVSLPPVQRKQTEREVLYLLARSRKYQ